MPKDGHTQGVGHFTVGIGAVTDKDETVASNHRPVLQPARQGVQVGETRPNGEHHPVRLICNGQARRGRRESAAIDEHIRRQFPQPDEQTSNIVRELRARSADTGPARTAAPPGNTWQCSQIRFGSVCRRAAAANDTNPGSGGQPDAAASVPPAGSNSTRSTFLSAGQHAAVAAASVVAPDERTAPNATTVTSPSRPELHQAHLTGRSQDRHHVSVRARHLEGENRPRATVRRPCVHSQHDRGDRDGTGGCDARRWQGHGDDLHPVAGPKIRRVRTGFQCGGHHV